MNYRNLFLATLFISFPLLKAIPQPQQPHFSAGAKAPMGPGALPEPTPEELEKALAEIDTFFKNMSEDEMNDFMGFLDDVEKGKIDLNELLPPELQQPVTPIPEPKKAEEKPVQPEVKPVVKQKEFKRDFNTAQTIVTSLLERLDSLRLKASSMRKVGETLAPLDKSIDTFIYYLHVLKKKEHIEQLISDSELLPLHDALRDLNDSLKRHEPKVIVPEFGLEEDRTDKERSKQALKTIIAALNSAFKQQSVIPNLEKLFKKYEPEIVKKRKEMEEREERAKKESEQMKGWKPSEIRIKRESEYGSGAGGRQNYMDWNYADGRRGGSGDYGAGQRGTAGGGTGAGAAESKAGTPKAGGKTTQPAKEAKESKTETPKTARPSTPSPVDDALDDFKTGFEQVRKEVASQLKPDALDQYLIDANDLAPVPEVNASLKNIGAALQSLTRQRDKSIDQKIRKLSGSFKKNAEQKRDKIVADNKKIFEPIYKKLVDILKATKAAIENGHPNNIPMTDEKLYAHLGYGQIGRQPIAARQVIALNPGKENFINDFLEGYEIMFKEPADKVQERTDLINFFTAQEQQAIAALAGARVPQPRGVAPVAGVPVVPAGAPIGAPAPAAPAPAAARPADREPRGAGLD